MPKSLTSFFVDDASVTSREVESPKADWNSGAFGGGGSPGIGIGTETPNLEESLPNWTLLDQFGNARQAQIGQYIGGSGFVDRSSVDWPSSGGESGTLPDSTIRLTDNDTLDGSGTLILPAEGAWLADLATGWEEDPTP